MTTMTESTTKKEPGRLAVILAYFLSTSFWGSTYYFIGVALGDFHPSYWEACVSCGGNTAADL